MTTHETQSTFISLIHTLAEDIRFATSVSKFSRAQALARFPLTRFLARSMAGRKEAQLQSQQRVFRYSNANQSASSSLSLVRARG